MYIIIILLSVKFYVKIKVRIWLSSIKMPMYLQAKLVMMFQLVMRHNVAGDIFIDGHSIKKLDLKSLRRNIASVSQEPSLFSGTIKDNLRIGKMDATDEEIIEAATTANVHSFISKLPNEYLTEVRMCSPEQGMQ